MRYGCSQIAVGCFELTQDGPARPIPAMQSPAKPVRASYDAARDGNEVVNIWANADALNADAANSLAVRTKLRKRDRYERANNGHKCGITRTHANYVVGTGPKLKMQSRSAGFNRMVEDAWARWCKATKFARQLRKMHRAKVGDGEALAVVVTDEAVKDKVKIKLSPVECDRLTSPTYRADTENYVDGITLDSAGNPISYDILDRHPGSNATGGALASYTRYAAKFVCHWYLDERPEQNRGVPEMSPTLNLFPTTRRFREATVAAAETAADFSLVMEMGMAQDGNDEVAPFTTLPIDKRTLMTSPAGAKASQLRAEHPATTYEMFNRENLSEEARPISMPRNIAGCDSSGYSYSGGQLDHQPYFVSIAVEHQECEDDVVEKAFALWFEEAVWAYGWAADSLPKHSWGWPGKPHTDPVKTGTGRKIALTTAQTALGRIYAEDGEDIEDVFEQMAREFGVGVEEIRRRALNAIFPDKNPGVQSDGKRPDIAERNAVDETEPPGKTQAAAYNRLIHGLNGNGRIFQ